MKNNERSAKVRLPFYLLLAVGAAIGAGCGHEPNSAHETKQAAETKPTGNGETALDRYIAKPDPAFAWKLAATVPGEGLKTYVIDLTSQTWRTAVDVDKPLWKHWLTITVPDKAKPGTAFLTIGGGSSDNPQPGASSQAAAALALATGTCVAELTNVPNQPLHFTDSKDVARVEDDIIAYGRVKFIDTMDENWLVRLAMVKSAIRAMDAMQAFLKTPEGGGINIEHFVVSGGSKRGWTTWLVGVEDPRVIAIIPLVIDALNSEKVTRHHYEAYGFFSTALEDYVKHGIFPGKIGTPGYKSALAIEDPYNYRGRDRLKIPKFMINASGDEFFLPDNAQFYYSDMPEEKYIRYVPNAKHSLAGSDARESLTAFYQSVLNNTPRPKFSWKKEADGTLVVTVKDKPSQVSVWQATNPKARDFRLDVIGKAYTAMPLVESAPGVYTARPSNPVSGFTAFFVELVYENGTKYPFKFTTEVSVVPDVLPYKWEDALKAKPEDLMKPRP